MNADAHASYVHAFLAFPLTCIYVLLFFLLLSLVSQWRYTETFPPTIARWDYMSWQLYWWWLFFSAEFFLAIAVWVGLAQRLFPVQRIKVTMDDITAVDDQVGYNAR